MDYITTFIETITTFFIIKKYISKKLSISLYDLFFLILITLILPSIPNTYTSANWITGQALLLTYIYFMKSEERKNIPWLFMLSYMTIFIIEILSALPYALFKVEGFESIINILGTISTFFVAILIFTVSPISKIYNLILQTNILYRLILLYSYFILAAVILLLKTHAAFLSKYFVIIVIVLSIFILSNVCVILYDRIVQKKNIELTYYQKNLPIYETLINDIRSNQHEFSNRIQTLMCLPDMYDNIDDLKKALKKYTAEYQKPFQAYTLLSLDKPLISASLYNMMIRAEKSGITIQFDISSTNITSLASEIELSDLCCVLLSNAIDASKSGDIIYFSLQQTSNGKTRVEVRNIIEHELSIQTINQFFEPGITTKENDSIIGHRHGYGLSNFKKQIEKLHGTVGTKCLSLNQHIWLCFYFIV